METPKQATEHPLPVGSIVVVHGERGRVLAAENIGANRFRYEILLEASGQAKKWVTPPTDISPWRGPLDTALSGLFSSPLEYDLRTESLRLSLAYEYDRMVSLSSSRVNLEQSLDEPEIIHPDAGQLTNPKCGIQKGEDYGIVSIAPRGRGVDGSQQGFKLEVRKSRDYFSWRLRDLHPCEWILCDDPLAYKPGPEGPSGTQVAVNGVPRKAVLLGLCKWVLTKAPLLLQVEDEGPYLANPYLGHIGGEPLGTEKRFKVAHAVGDNI